MPEPEYSIQGYAPATSSHAAAYKAPLYGIITGIWHAKPVIKNPHSSQNNKITVNRVVAGTGSMHKINI